jgi:ABC-type transport system substrate-binding protein
MCIVMIAANVTRGGSHDPLQEQRRPGSKSHLPDGGGHQGRQYEPARFPRFGQRLRSLDGDGLRHDRSCSADQGGRAGSQEGRGPQSRDEAAYSNPDLDAKIGEALSIADAEKRKVVMADIQKILQDSGIIIQPYWRNLYNHSVPAVKSHGMHPTFEHDFGKVWLDA